MKAFDAWRKKADPGNYMTGRDVDKALAGWLSALEFAKEVVKLVAERELDGETTTDKIMEALERGELPVMTLDEFRMTRMLTHDLGRFSNLSGNPTGLGILYNCAKYWVRFLQSHKTWCTLIETREHSSLSLDEVEQELYDHYVRENPCD